MSFAGDFGDASRLQKASWLLVGAFLAFALVVDHVASAVFAIFFLAGLWLLFSGRTTKPDRLAQWVLLAFLAYFLVGVLSFFLGEQTRLGEKILGRDIRFLGAAVVYFVFVASALPERLLRKLLAIAGIVTGVFAVVEVLLADQVGYRASGRTVSIVFGHLAAALFAVNLGIAMFERRGRGFSGAGALFAIVAAVLSGTRGALVSVLVVFLLATFVHFYRRRRMRARSIMVVGVATVLVVVAGTSWILPRVEHAFLQYEAYEVAAERRQGNVTPRGCLSDTEALEVILSNGRRQGRVSAEIVVRESPMGTGCSEANAIRLVNESEATASWLSPYRSLPIGATGQLYVDGRATISLERGAERTRAKGERLIEIPAAQEVDETRFRVRLAPGARLDFVPVEVARGEYAFIGTDTSIGSRMDILAGTLRQLDFSPLGQGTGTWPLAMAREAEAGRMSWRLSGYDHAHNDYLNTVLERGWLGLVTLLGLFVAPLAWCHARGVDWRSDALRLLVVSVAVSGITETVFNHSISITYYAVLVLLLMTARPDSGTAVPAPQTKDS